MVSVQDSKQHSASVYFNPSFLFPYSLLPFLECWVEKYMITVLSSPAAFSYFYPIFICVASDITCFLLNKSCCQCCQAASHISSTPVYFSSCHFDTKLGLWYKLQHFLGLQLDHPPPLCTFKCRGKVLFCISNCTSLQQKSFVRTSP